MPKKISATKEQLVRILERALVLSEDLSLCGEGRELVKEAKALLGHANICHDELELRVCIEGGFEVPPGVDTDDEDAFEVTVKLGGKVLSTYNLGVNTY